ncbi:glycosyltransferase family 4 protein [Desulfobacula sp.]|uniref:glycosyltransferase family 4 protein n=1 Tax=Desulfobacula sp. TaxID=2593537 RepID=UPI00262A6152|nr:glycosyltransferase family 4 protein [Desulfobacula sp.]
MKKKQRPKILFFVTEDWYFWSHRLPIARAAKRAGFDVVVVTRIDKHQQKIENEGFRVVPVTLRRQGKNIFQEIKAIVQIVRMYHQEKPDLVHHVAMKPILYGTLAAIFNKTPHVVNAYAGLGFLFISENWKARVLKYFFLGVYKLLFLSKQTYAIFQNPEDRLSFITLGIIDKKRSVLIRGSGVNISDFHITAEPEGKITILLASRMLWDKGIGELIKATKILKHKQIDFRTILVGKPDNENPRSIPENSLKEWHDKGIIEWWGYQDHMPEILSKAHIVVLPSYREGVPKGLLEAAACGKPIITTDVPGCREVVKHLENGFLVPVKDVDALAQALEEMIKDAGLRRKMGAKGRILAEKYFSEQVVVDKTMTLYRQMIGRENRF